MKGKRWPNEHRLVMRLGQRFHDPIRLFFGEIVPADEQMGDRDTAHVGRDPGIRVLGNRRAAVDGDRKSTRLNSSHGYISYAVFCLKKKKPKTHNACTKVIPL